MTQCKDLLYKRYTIEQYRQELEKQIAAIEQATTKRQVIDARAAIVAADSAFCTMSALADARYTLNTRDEFYIAETEYYDHNRPVRDELFARYGKVLMGNPIGAAYAEELSPALPLSLKNLIKAASPEIIEERQQEAAIVMRYSKLMSTMTFEFDGETMPLSVVRGYLCDNDRSVRKAAAEAIGRGLSKHRDELDGIFDELVKVRDKMAKKLGFKSYTELGYCIMDRKDFDKDSVKVFRESVLETIVPAVARLKEELKEQLGLDEFKFYDNEITLSSGETVPELPQSEMFAQAESMYKDMDEEIGKFMGFMIGSGAFDVEARDGKWGGGYCTEFHDYKQPFILANWNGTCDDVDVLTHEFGHAFASMNAMSGGVYELNVGGMETAECHSMTMELLCHPYMEKFFGKSADRYRFRHLMKCIDFIPYGVIVDEFQHIIYESPDMSPKERNEAFKALTKKYMPYMTYDGIPYLEEGTRWQYQMHIYESPFYYIDYTLAQTVALEFYAQSLKDYGSALKNYIAFVKKGGKFTLTELVKQAGLSSPFERGALADVVDAAQARLKQIKENIGG